VGGAEPYSSRHGADFPLRGPALSAFRCFPSLALILASAAAYGQNWTQPTQEELQMTSEASAPGAAVVCLSLAVFDDYNRTMTHTVYTRLKILNEKGREFADVEIPYGSEDYKVKSIEARTIHSDGTVIPFLGKPYDKLIEKDKHAKYKAKVFTLPDAQVGSILEYRITVGFGPFWFQQPRWFVQQRYFIRRAHYDFAPNLQYSLDFSKYASVLPKGTSVQWDPKRKIYSVDMADVLPILDEDYMPPLDSVSYRVLFYFTEYKSPDEYWKAEGVAWSKEVDQFMNVNKLGSIAGQLVGPADTPRQKAQKIYDAVMKLENTSLTRERSQAENKAHKVKVRNAEDIWNAKRGDSDEIAVLFVGLARAAGLKAYAAEVTDRSRAIFVPNFMSINQLDDYVAIVELDGKEEFLDPGVRYCPFGDLYWKHAGTKGLRQTDHGTEIGLTPMLGYKSTSVFRNADLTIEPDGRVVGSLHIGMTGNQALAWRLRALSTDEQEMRKDFEDLLKEELPPGIEVKTNHVMGLPDYASTLMMVMDVSGSMGTTAGKRLFIPSSFFEASKKALFAEAKRTTPVELDYPYARQDNVTMHLPPTLAVESAPKDAEIPLPQNALYRASFKESASTLEAHRLFLLANTLYSVSEYESLKEFYEKVNSKDQEQAVLRRAGSMTPAATAGDGAH
jgi:hypothetical protein